MNNQIIYTGTYTIYNFLKGITENFIVEFRSSNSNYKDYDNYSVKLKYD